MMEIKRWGLVAIVVMLLAGLASMAELFEHAKSLNARVILQGDRKQQAKTRTPARSRDAIHFG